MTSYKSIPDNEKSSLLIDNNKGPEGLDEESEQSLSFPKTLQSKMSPGMMVLLGAWSAVLVIAGVSPSGMNLLGRQLGKDSVIQVCVEEYNLITKRPSVGATVNCVDMDAWTGSDFMGSGTTGGNGCAYIFYDGGAWWDYYWGDGWKPDIRCDVTKSGFVRNTPLQQENVDPTRTAVFSATLYRDRVGLGDYGHDNGCGPDFTEKYGLNDIATSILGFGAQCGNHDKCYYDCQIFKAFGGDQSEDNAKNAMDFCDLEMLDSMNSLCNVNHGHIAGLTDDACRGVAATVYAGIQTFAQSHYRRGLMGEGGSKVHSCVDPTPPSENLSYNNVY